MMIFYLLLSAVHKKKSVSAPPKQISVNSITSNLTASTSIPDPNMTDQNSLLFGIDPIWLQVTGMSDIQQCLFNMSGLDFEEDNVGDGITEATGLVAAINESNVSRDVKPVVLPNIEEVIIISDDDGSVVNIKTEPKNETQQMLERRVSSLQQENRSLRKALKARENLHQISNEWSLPMASSTLQIASAYDGDKENSS